MQWPGVGRGCSAPDRSLLVTPLRSGVYGHPSSWLQGTGTHGSLPRPHLHRDPAMLSLPLTSSTPPYSSHALPYLCALSLHCPLSPSISFKILPYRSYPSWGTPHPVYRIGLGQSFRGSVSPLSRCPGQVPRAPAPASSAFL